MISVPGDTRPATPVRANEPDDHPTDTSGVSAFAPQLPAVDRDPSADRRRQLEAPGSHRSNAQRRRETRAAAHVKQAAAAAKRTETAAQNAPAPELPTPCRTKHPVGVKRCVLCDAHAEQGALAKAAALKAAPADEPEATLAERAAQAAEFKAALANTRVAPEAQQKLADALDRFRHPKAAQEPARTLPSPTQPPVAAPQIGHDGGTPGKAERSVAASTAETGNDLRERCDASGSCDAEPTPETPDLGKQYEQQNNKLQQSMRLLDEARAITTLFSMRKCGVANIAGAVAVTQKMDGSGGFNGLFRCGSVWSCPECMPVVRADRAAVLEEYALAWATEHDAEKCTGKAEDAGKTHAGHGMAMATFTSRHGQYAVLEDRLIFDKHGKPVKDDDGKQQVRKGQLQRTADAWRRMLQSRWWRRLRAKYGIVGATRALEVTHSWASAWHTHIHAVVWFEMPVTDDVAKELETELYVRWQAECKVAGLGRPSRKHGVKVDPARRGAEGAADIAKYLVKVQDKDKAKPAKAAGDAPVNHISRDARPSADQARRLKVARTRRDAARERGDTRAQADADSLIADIREEIGQAARARALGNELVGGHNKLGRKEGRTALEILRLALAGDAAELELWHQYERATKGTKMLTWTGDVRERLERLTGAAERDAQEVMAEDDAKQVKAVLVLIDPEPWKTKVAAVPGRRGQLRVAVKVASDNAIEAGIDMEVGARTAVRELLESWGLTWDTDMYGPGTQTKGSRGVDTDTGELYFVPEHPTPQDRRDRRHPSWQNPDQLHANAAILGTTPRDYVRPEQAARRASGLPIARELSTPTTDSTPATTKTLCIVCDIPVNPDLAEPLHLLCDPFTTS